MSSDTSLNDDIVLSSKASTPPPSVLNTHEPLSPQDKVNLYEVLQTLARALRRIKHEENQTTRRPEL